MEVIDKTSANWLVMTDDGLRNIGRSNRNRLLIDHDLWGLLRDGDEILVIPEGKQHPRVEVIPEEGGESFEIQIGDYAGVHIGPHQKHRLTDALIEGRESGGGDTKEAEAEALVRLHDDIRENEVRHPVMNQIAEKAPFTDQVEITDDGWLINDHLLLTWEQNFHHPEKQTFKRSGSSVSRTSRQTAYQLTLTAMEAERENRELRLNGQDYRLTNAEMQFLAYALWAIENAPKGV